MTRAVLLGALLMLILARGAKGQEKTYFLGRANSLTRIMRGEQWAGHAEDSLPMETAANESESAQLLICTGGHGLRDVRVRIEPLSDPKTGATIPPECIELHRLGWVYCDNKYPWGPPGWFPDPLYPITGTFDVEPIFTQPIWVTVHAPPGTPAGRYEGYLRVEPANESPSDIRVDLTVWAFELPQQQSLKTIFALRNSQLAEIMAGRTCGPDWTKYVSQYLMIEWCQFFTRYHITPELYSEGGSTPENQAAHTCIPFLHARWSGDKLFVDWSELDPIYQGIVDGGGSTLMAAYFGGWLLPPDDDDPKYANWVAEQDRFLQAYLPQAEAHFREKGWLDKAYFYCRDEPPPDLIPAVKEQLRLAKALAPGIKRLVVVQDKEKLYPPVLEGYVDRWVIPWTWYSQKKAAPVQAMGVETWGYTGVCGTAAPNFFIRDPMMQTRLAPWQAWQQGMDGLLHWGVNFWGEYDNAKSVRGSREDMNADGTLRPSWDNGIMGGGYMAYPGPGMHPYPSVRLVNLRDGMEDYEYLVLLNALLAEAEVTGHTSRATSRAAGLVALDGGVVRGIRWANDPNTLLNVRASMAETIEALQAELGGRLCQP